MDWIQKPLEAAKISNESNQNQKPNSKNRKIHRWARVHKEIEKGTMFDHVRTSSTQQLRRDPFVWIGIHKKLRVDAQKLKKIKQERGDP